MRLQHLTSAVGADEKFWRAVVEVGWLAEDDRGIVVPGWDTWLSESAKKRFKALIYKRRQRGRRPKSVPKVSTKRPPKTAPTDREERREIEKKNKSAVEEIPEKLKTAEFIAAWEEWKAERKAKGKPITARAAKLQLKDLAELTPENAVLCVQASIRNGWTGIFADRFVGGGSLGQRAANAKGGHGSGNIDQVKYLTAQPEDPNFVQAKGLFDAIKPEGGDGPTG